MMRISNDLIDSNALTSFTRSRDSGYMIVIFLIWPFIAFLLALRDIGNEFYRRIIIAFFVLFGFTFHVNPIMDGGRYAIKLKEAFDRPTSDFFGIFNSLFSDQGALDFTQPLITFLVSRFTDMHQILFAAFALFFGYFQLKSIGLLHQIYSVSRSRNAWVFIVFLFFVVPIFDINGFRMWSAAWVYFLGVYSYLISGEKRFIWLVLASAGVHFSFLLPSAIFVIYLLVGNRLNFFVILAACSFLLSELPIPLLQSYAATLGSGIEMKFLAYSHEGHMENVQEAAAQGAWFLNAPLWVLYGFVMLIGSIYFNRKHFSFDKGFRNLLSFSLLFLTFANVVSLIPSGGRFRSVFLLFSTAQLIHYFSKYYTGRRMHNLVLVCMIPMVLHCLLVFRIGSETLNTVLFLPSPAILAFFDIEWPVKQWLF